METGKNSGKEQMSRTRIPTRFINEIHKLAVQADFKTDWEFIVFKCLSKK